MDIEYREIERLPGYRFGSDGSIWSCWTNGGKLGGVWRCLKAMRTKTGDGVSIKKEYYRVPRLVLEAFVGPCPEGQDARHINGDVCDNRVENLEWATPEDGNFDDGVVYKTLPHLPGYRFGDDGSLWSCRTNGGKLGSTWHRVKPCSNGRSMIVTLFGDSYCLHCLILEAFVGPRPYENYEGCHNNGDHTDSRLTNLRWDTAASNQADRILHGTDLRGEDVGTSKLTEEEVKMIRWEYANTDISQPKLALKFGVTQPLIAKIILREVWAHGEIVDGEEKMARKKRKPRLTQEEISGILADFGRGDMAQWQIAIKYGVNPSAVGRVIKRSAIQ